MQTNFVSTLISDNIVKDALIAVLTEKIVQLEKQLELHKNAHRKCVEILQTKEQL